MEGSIYLLCAATALMGGILLVRGYLRSRTRLLLWCGLCFLILFAENMLLFIDDILVPDVRLVLFRRSLAAVSGSRCCCLVWSGTPRDEGQGGDGRNPWAQKEVVMELILSGALVMGFAVAGLFFVRFWRETKDRLFFLLALAFFLMAANRVQLAMWNRPGTHEEQYLVRFLAFAMILVAILDKNRPLRRRPRREVKGIPPTLRHSRQHRKAVYTPVNGGPTRAEDSTGAHCSHL